MDIADEEQEGRGCGWRRERSEVWESWMERERGNGTGVGEVRMR